MSHLLTCQVESRIHAERGCCAWCVELKSLLLAIFAPLIVVTASAQTPMIVTPPTNTNVFAGATAFFNVMAQGGQPLSYRWLFGPTLQPIPDTVNPTATNATLKISAADSPDQGQYAVRVSNGSGNTQSNPAFLTVTRVDFGDAPPPYPIAFHTIMTQGFQLGQSITFEPLTRADPNGNASADPGDDGVIFDQPVPTLIPGRATPIHVLAPVEGNLDAWIDFDGNGDWAGPIEQVLQKQFLHSGQNDFIIPVPPTAHGPTNIARFRFSSAGGLGPAGGAADGEVEDYRVQITPSADLAVNIFSPDQVPPGGEGQCIVRISNQGPSAAPDVTISNFLSGAVVVNAQSDTDGCAIQANGVVCNSANLMPNEMRTVVITFRAQQQGLVTNAADVRSPVFDPDTSNNRFVASIRAADPIMFTQQPQSQRVFPGSAVAFSVEAKGIGTLSYQWEMDGALLATETRSTFTLTAQNSAQVRCQVSDAYGSRWSDYATLTVIKPPQISAQPLPMAISCNSGSGFQLEVQVTGTPPFKFQWRLNGENIRGASERTYVVASATRSNAGVYTVAVMNEAGIAFSEKAQVICSDIFTHAGSDFVANPVPLPPGGVPGLTAFAGVIKSDNCSFTTEPGEPKHADRPGNHSVWYQWMAPGMGIATFDTVGSGFDTLLAVYQTTASGTFSNIVSDEDRGGYKRSALRFNAFANENYLIVVDGFNEECGPFVLEWNFQPVQANQPLLPRISVQPAPRSGRRGEVVVLSVDATPYPTTTQLSYQWMFNGQPIPNANNSMLQVPLIDEHVGTYFVRTFSGAATAAPYTDSRPTIIEIGPNPCIQSQDKPEDVFLSCANNSGGANGGGPGLMRAAKIMSGDPGPFISVALGIPDTQIMNNTNSTADIDCFNIGTASRWLALQVTNDAAAAGSLLRIDTRDSLIPTQLSVYHFVPPSCVHNQSCMQTYAVGCDTNSGGGSYALIAFNPPVGGQYLAFADGLDGAQGIIHFNWLLGRPPTLDLTQSNCTQVVLTNTAVTINCDVTNASPTPTYTWYYYGNLLSDQTNSTIVFSSVDCTNAGCYSVVVSNAFGVVSNKCCLVVDPPLLHYQADMSTNPSLCIISAVLGPNTILQRTTNVTPTISWDNVVTNTTTNCNFQYSAPMLDTNGYAIPQRFYRTRKQ